VVQFQIVRRLQVIRGKDGGLKQRLRRLEKPACRLGSWRHHRRQKGDRGFIKRRFVAGEPLQRSVLIQVHDFRFLQACRICLALLNSQVTQFFLPFLNRLLWWLKYLFYRLDVEGCLIKRFQSGVSYRLAPSAHVLFQEQEVGRTRRVVTVSLQALEHVERVVAELALHLLQDFYVHGRTVSPHENAWVCGQSTLYLVEPGVPSNFRDRDSLVWVCGQYAPNQVDSFVRNML
jgi:hypothetical protein